MSLLRIEPRLLTWQASVIPLGHQLKKLILPLIQDFSHDKMPINMKMLVFFLGKCVWTATKTLVVDIKSQKALALLHLALGMLQNAANSSIEPTEFAAELTTKMKSSKANL